MFGLVGTADLEPLSYLALGDSYTIGESVPAADRWPMQLAARLRDAGIPIADPRIIARTGWTTEELAAAMDAAGLDPCYDLVSLSIGVNDQYRGLALDGYRQRYTGLLERAVSLAGGMPERVLVLSIPDWSATPFAANDPRGVPRIAADLEAFNAAKRELSEARGVVYVDITPATQRMGSDPELTAADGLHPSAALYARWVGQMEESVRTMLAEQRDPC